MAQKKLELRIEVTGNGDVQLRKANGQFTQAKSNVKGLEAQITSLNGKVSMSANEWNRVNNALQNHLNTVKEGEADYKRISRTMQEVSQVRAKNLATNMNGVSSATGAASASVLELGRIVSDSPYGIRGIANNVSQLATQVAFMSGTMNAATGRALGFAGALRSIGTAFMGPLGILVAFQGAVALIEAFANGMFKAKEETEGLTDALDKQIELIERIDTLLDPTPTGNSIIDRLIGIGGGEAFDIFLRKFSTFRKKYEEMVELGTADRQNVAKLRADYLELLNTRRRIAQTTAQLDEARDASTPNIGLIDNLESQLSSLLLKEEEYAKKFDVATKEGKTVASKVFSVTSFRARVKEYEREVIRFQEELLKLTTFGRREILQVEQQANARELELQKTQFEERERLRLQNYINRLDDRRQRLIESGKLTAQAEAEIEAERLQAQENFNEAMIQSEWNFIAARLEQIALFAEQKRALELEIEYEEFERRTAEREARLTMEYENAQAALQLESEIYDARKEVQSEYLTFTQAGANLLNRLAGENEALQKAMFFLQKGAAIAQVVVDATQSIASANVDAAAARMANIRNFNAAGGVLNPVAGAAYLGMEANITRQQVQSNTLTKISAATAIANILATMIGGNKSVNGGSGGSGGGGTTIEAGFNPSFDILGSTGENQIAEAIAQQGGDRRAFILWDDIEEAQGIAQNAASIGTT